MSNKHTYKLVYLLEPNTEGKTEKELNADPRPIGACDAIIVHSILFQEDGSRSELIISMDGETGDELSDNELFKSWTMLTARLAESNTLQIGKKSFCKTVFNSIKETMLATEVECSHEDCICKQSTDSEKNLN